MFWVASIVTVSFSRAAFREILRFARRRGYNQRYAIVVGGGEPAAEVLRVLHRRRDTGIQLLGRAQRQAGEPRARRCAGWAASRTSASVLAAQPIDIVIIALPHSDYPRLSTVLNEIGDEPVDIHFVPDLFNLASLRGGVEEFESIAFIHLRESPLYGWNRVLKRGFDLGFGAARAPGRAAAHGGHRRRRRARPRAGRSSTGRSAWGWTAAASACSSSARCVTDAEAQTGPRWAVPDDPRRTRLGAFLRGVEPGRAAAALQRAARRDEPGGAAARAARASSRSSAGACPATCSATR